MRDKAAVRLDNMRMPDISRARALAYLGAVIAALVVGGRFLVGSDGGEATASAQPTATLAAHELEPAGTVTSGPEQAVLVVHVAGAVRHPGIYEVPDGSRVDDAIAAAGGAKRGAKLQLLNLAAPLSDGQQVLVPGPGAAGDSATSAPGVAATPPPVDLNTASLEELDTLPGVGPVTAQRILDYRSEHGPFASVDELDAVPGIGPARLEQLRELVTA
jgi:competence protein ComEA